MPEIGHIGIDPACIVPPALLPPEQPVEIPPPPPAPNPCDQLGIAAFADGLPMPGSPRFCEVAEDIKKGFADIADALIDWLMKVDISTSIKDLLHIKPTGNKALVLFDYIIDLWNQLADGAVSGIEDAIKVIQDVGKYLYAMQKCLTTSCGPSASFGVWASKMMLSMVEDMDFGFTAVLDVELHVSLRFDIVKRWLDMMEEYCCPIEPPKPEEATRAWLLNRITREQRDCIWKLHGLDPATYETFALSEKEQLDWREAIQYVRRVGGDDKFERDTLRLRGFVEAGDVAMAQEMYWELPTISDHLHWLQRNVFDTDYVSKYHLMDGFADDATISQLPGLNGYTSIARKPGKTFWEQFGPDLTALGMRMQYAANHYAAHWIQPSPEQMKEFIYRSDEIFQATGEHFTVEDFERILTEQDYGVLARKWFAATAYSVPAISYIKDMFRQDVIGFDELKVYHKRLGYTEEDANRFADIDRIQKVRMRTQATHGWTTKAANDAFATGQIDLNQHADIFTGLGYTLEEAADAREAAEAAIQVRIATRARSKALTTIASTVSQALDVGAIANQDAVARMVEAGWGSDFAIGFVATQSALAGIKTIRQGISYVRRRTLDGSLDFPTAAQELQRFGLTGDAIARNIAVWRLSMTPRRKHRTAAQIVNDAASGHITTAQAIVRLTNLGYDNADTMLYMADIQAKVSSIAAKNKAAQQKSILAKSKAQAALAKQAQKHHDDIVKAMKREIPVSKLQKWAKLGIIGRDFFNKRMSLYGYTATDAEWYYEEACKGKGAACVETTPEPQGAAPASGGSGTTTGGGQQPTP